MMPTCPSSFKSAQRSFLCVKICGFFFLCVKVCSWSHQGHLFFPPMCRCHRSGDLHHPLHFGVPDPLHVPPQGDLSHQWGQRGRVSRERRRRHNEQWPQLHGDHRWEQEGMAYLSPRGWGLGWDMSWARVGLGWLLQWRENTLCRTLEHT